VTGGGGRGRQRRKKRSVDDGGVRGRCGPVHQRWQTASCRSRRRGAAQLAQTSYLAREIPFALYTRDSIYLYYNNRTVCLRTAQTVCDWSVRSAGQYAQAGPSHSSRKKPVFGLYFVYRPVTSGVGAGWMRGIDPTSFKSGGG